MNKRIAIIILNWNNATDTIACGRTALEFSPPKTELIIVDNGSDDDSLKRLKKAFPGKILLNTGMNLGYAGGNNLGILKALENDSKIICILNNDVLVTPGFLEPLFKVFEAGGTIAVSTPLIVDRSNPSRIWALGQCVNWKTGQVLRHRAGEAVVDHVKQAPFQVDSASGAAMVINAEILAREGMLDESYFLYYEEVDWCLKLRKAGYKILAVPESLVYHKVSATLGTNSPLIDYYMLRNQLKLVASHWTGFNRLAVLGRLTIRDILSILAFTLKSQNGKRVPNRNARLQALFDASRGKWGKMSTKVEEVCSAT